MDAMATQGSQQSASLDEARLRAIFDVLVEGLIVWGPDGSVLACNRQAADIIGIPLERLEQLEFDEMLEMAQEHLRPIGPDGTPEPRSTYPAIVAARQRSPVLGQVMGVHRSDGRSIWLEIDVRVLEDPVEGSLLISSFRDITDRRQAEALRIEAEQRFRQGFERSAFGLAILDLHHTCTSANPALSELLGYPVEALLGRRPLEFLHPMETDGAREGVERLLRRDGPPFYKREHRMVRSDGSFVWVLVDMTLVRDVDDEPAYYFVQVRDLTDRKRAEEALEHQALHDDLTRLPNRLLLVDRLSHSLARAERTGKSLAVLFLDLDRFKLVNDGLGHVVGDQLLVEVAERLQRTVRGSDTVARFGGDEFVIVREDVDDVTDAVEFAERVAAKLHEPISLSGRDLYATTSIGIAFGGEGASAEQLLRDADAAMYRAKDLGPCPHRAVQPRAAAAGGGAPGPRERAPPGRRTRRAPPPVPADRAARRRSGRRRRGAPAVAPARARRRPSDRVHPRRRGDRPHHPDRHLGARTRAHRAARARRATTTPPTGRCSR